MISILGVDTLISGLNFFLKFNYKAPYTDRNKFFQCVI